MLHQNETDFDTYLDALACPCIRQIDPATTLANVLLFSVQTLFASGPLPHHPRRLATILLTGHSVCKLLRSHCNFC